MSRFGYDDEGDYPNAWALWERAITTALGSDKGQQILRDLRDALLALPKKRLIEGRLACNGEVCTMGALVAHRRRDEERAKVLAELEQMITEDAWIDYEAGTKTLEAGESIGVGVSMSCHLAWLNDQLDYGATPEERYEKVLSWVERAILVPA
jgi:hypothetical protein